jgi:hypothetical protein
MAENTGGTCMMSPRRAGSAASICASVGRTSVVPVMAPSASSLSRLSPQRRVKRYSLVPSMM